ncbi:MAG: hypothetical protein RL026_1995 [Pseudomonadota bacterium]|jgi:signal transduction histidine kinase
MTRLLRHSLSLRLLLIFLLLALTFGLGTVAALRWAYAAGDIRSLVSGHLILHVDYVRRDIGSPPRIENAEAITRKVPVDIRIAGPEINWASDARVPAINSLDFGDSSWFNASPGSLADELPGVQFATYERHNYLKFREGQHDIVVVTPKIGTVPAGPPVLPMLVAIALATVLAGYLAVRQLFRPIAAIRRGTARFGVGEFSHPIPVARSDELGALAADINTMARQVQGMLDAKRQLLLGISHELRSPLSRLKLELEFMQDDDLRRSVGAEVDEMSRIITTLLEAERLNRRHEALALQPVSPRILVEDVLAEYFARDEHRIQLDCLPVPDAALLDPARITLMLKNLVANALRYSTPEEGPVQVQLRSEGANLVFSVRDQGPGIPAAQAAHIGEPFYRGDASRTRGTGGTGLGLYLATLVATAHGGTLVLRPHSGRGAWFEACIPLRT